MIRKATTNDLEDIDFLYNSHSLDISRVTDTIYATKVQRDGFLIALDSKNDIYERIQTNFLFNVYEMQDKIVGFVIINKEVYFPEDSDNIIWFNKKLKENYYHSDTFITLHEIIVNQTYRRKGIASFLLEDSLKILKEKHYTDLFSIVATGPLTNCASLLFHTRNEFERACISMPDDLFELKNYQSLLFHKRIK